MWQTWETVWCILKKICVDFFKLNVATSTSTQISDHHILYCCRWTVGMRLRSQINVLPYSVFWFFNMTLQMFNKSLNVFTYTNRVPLLHNMRSLFWMSVHSILLWRRWICGHVFQINFLDFLFVIKKRSHYILLEQRGLKAYFYLHINLVKFKCWYNEACWDIKRLGENGSVLKPFKNKKNQSILCIIKTTGKHINKNPKFGYNWYFCFCFH